MAEKLMAGRVIEDSCWRWGRGHFGNGYGAIYIPGQAQPVGVHVVSYQTFVGPIPPDCELDHVLAKGCRFRDCWNPDHLEAVPHKENAFRSPDSPTTINALKTHCIRGHAFTPENTYIRANGKRTCIQCRREAEMRRYYAGLKKRYR